MPIVNLSKLSHDLLNIKSVDAINSLSAFYVQNTVLSKNKVQKLIKHFCLLEAQSLLEETVTSQVTTITWGWLGQELNRTMISG